MIIDYQLYGRCTWHVDCEVGKGNGIMKEIKREENQSLMECLHCGEKGYYPVGSVGCINVKSEVSNKKQNILPGLDVEETRYFQWLLCNKLGQITDEQWTDLTKLNQKTLAFMSNKKHG